MINRLKITAASLLILSATRAYAQAPIITHVDKYKGGAGNIITLAGNNFGTNAVDLAVYFGASKGAIQFVSDQLLEVAVPAGATFENISVTDVTTGLTGFSGDQFLLSYGGEHPFDKANLVAQTDIVAEPGLYDLCLCDLDNDGNTDIATSADKAGATSLSILHNTTVAPASISFSGTPLSIGARSVHVKCGDLNGDGKKDLVVSEGGSGGSLRLIILKNTTVGAISFVQQFITLANKSPKRIEIMDLDLDGKPELIVTDQRAGNNSLLILPNTSSLATISFGAEQALTIPFTNGDTDGLAVQDINNDQLPDIITTQFLEANSNIYIFENSSTLGTMRFADPVTLTLSGSPINLRVGDLDNDSKPDIAVTQILNGAISIFLNETTTNDIKFSTVKTVGTDPAPFGIDFGDLDGDGKLDVVVASLRGSSIVPKTLTLLNNQSTPGNVVFLKETVATPFISRHIIIGDLDGDGKPDISYASVDDSGETASKVSIFRNKSCIVPKISPTGPLVVCSSFPQQLEASVSAGATYQWKEDGTDIPLATNSNFTPILGQAVYTVAITSDGCTKASVGVDVTVIASGSAASPTMSSNSPVCLDGTMELSASSAGATGYDWTGPVDYIVSDPSGNATRSNFQVEFAGRYDVNVKVGVGVNECVAATGSVVVEMISLPTFRVDYPGNDIICTGSSKILSVSPNEPNFTFQWFNQLGQISGETGTTLSVNTSGTYHYEATSVLFPPPQCPIVDSESVAMLVVNLPVVAYQAPSDGCKDIPVTFTNQTTLDDAGGNFLWEFGDTSTSTDLSPTHTFTTVQNFAVKLTASYRGNTCPVSLTKPINILAAPTASITTPGNVFQLCPGDSLKLEVSSAFSSYLWSTLETTAFIFAKTGGNFSVELTNAFGCKVTPSQNLTLLPAPEMTATATPVQINIGQTTQLSATPAALSAYLWEPAESLNNPAIANPIATPVADTNYKVTGTGSNGCKGEATVEVKVAFDNITNLLTPSNFFSPNSDSFNDLWEVGSIMSFPQCGVKVYDDKGLKVFESKPYINEWDGTYHGKQLPNGVYYYFIQCEGEGKPKTGSITLIR